MLAVSCHDIAAKYYTTTTPGLRRKHHTAEQILASLGRLPTHFMHDEYYHYEQYPQEVADVVGYWAEYHLFGGVVLFDRGESGTDVSEDYLRLTNYTFLVSRGTLSPY